MNRPFHIHCVLMEEHVFHAIYLEKLIQSLPDDSFSVTALTGDIRRMGLLALLLDKLKIFGVTGTAMLAAQNILLQLCDLASLRYAGYFCSIRSVARHYGIPYFHPRNVNQPGHLDQLRSLGPDIILSSCQQIFKKNLLNLPKIACINRHTALLPAYRGVMPVIHMLANDETQHGVTIHTMEEAIDAGRILVQKQFSISADDTMYSTYVKGIQTSVIATLETIEKLRTTPVDRFPVNPVESGSYYSFPTADEGRRMRQHRKIMSFRDFRNRYY